MDVINTVSNFLLPVTDEDGNRVANDEGHFLYFNTQLGEIVIRKNPEQSNSQEDAREEESLQEEGLCSWSDGETLALITSYEKHKDALRLARKKKDVWIQMSKDMAKINVIKSAAHCERKWLNLLRTYKKIKDIGSKTGQGTPKKFKYFERIDEIMGDKPSNKMQDNSVTIDVGLKPVDLEKPNKECASNNSSGAEFNNSEEGSSTHTPKRKRSGNTEYFKSKQEYRKIKMEILREKEKKREKEREEKKELERTRLALEERKVLALEKIAKKYD